ncbi:MAG: DNA gyrase C-terminal beta-propeller domain-containing protein, partial [Anaerolineae bacterium]
AALIAAAGNGPQHIALITAAGYGKRVALADFPTQGRNGQGVVAAKLNEKTGELVGAALVEPADGLLVSFGKAPPRLLPAAELPEMGRPALGKPIPPLLVGEPVRGVCAVAVAVKALPAAGPKPTEAPSVAEGKARRSGPAPSPAAAPATTARKTRKPGSASPTGSPTADPPASPVGRRRSVKIEKP